LSVSGLGDIDPATPIVASDGMNRVFIDFCHQEASEVLRSISFKEKQAALYGPKPETDKRFGSFCAHIHPGGCFIG